MIGFYNYSVILTYIGLASSIVGMVNALEHNPRIAVLCLLFCGLCDMFDGTIARTCKRSDDAKKFGTQIDSLCDVICFGVFPAVLGYSIMPFNVFTVLCMVLYVLAAVIRLAYFNVQEINNCGEKRTYYTGLPVTSSALIMPIIALSYSIHRINTTYAYPIALLLTGIAFITPFKVKKPYMKGLAVLACFGAVVFYLVFRFGGSITCMRSFTGVA